MRTAELRKKLDAAPESSAEAAGLTYVTDRGPGIRRLKRGDGFRYVMPDGSPASAANMRRIRSLAVPPAYGNVWICPDPRGHIQAVGTDDRGRLQYRYHLEWAAARDGNKFVRAVLFGRALPKIRRRLEEDMGLPGIPKRKVLATVVYLLQRTMIRIGNQQYARQNESYGLTTLHAQHAEVRGDGVRFRFRGKSGVEHDAEVADARVARTVRKLQELPGQELFEYLDLEGAVRNLGSADVNAYLKEIAGDEFTAKDFRTWAGTSLAMAVLLSGDLPATKKVIADAIKQAADGLRNTPSVCRKCYVHPAVLEAAADGSLSGASAGDAGLLKFLEARLG